MKKLVIIGASGHGKVVADIALKTKKWDNIVFLDDNETLKVSMGLEVVGKTADKKEYKDIADFFVAIGDNIIREKVQEQLLDEGFSIATIIHSSAIIATDVKIASGTVIMAGVVINNSTKIGKGCIVNTSTSIDHDNLIGDYVHLSPGVHLAGGIKVETKCWLGIGSIVSNNVTITSKTRVGAGAVIIQDISESGTYIGIPAKKVKSRT